MSSEDDADLDEDIVALYGASPDEFMARRGELAAAAKDAGDAPKAKAITALRKPTLAAAVVNRLVHADPDAVGRLTALGDRLRDAQQNLEPDSLRELTKARRTLVGELARAALAGADQLRPTTALRDEVTATLDAALADPDVAAQLGRLTRAQHWSGFGVAAGTGPELTLVPGGKGRPRPAPKTTPTDAPKNAPAKASTAERRRTSRALEKARSAFDEADERLNAAERDDADGSARVKDLTARLGELQHELDDAKRDRDKARREVKAARTRRREARSALDRAERRAGE